MLAAKCMAASVGGRLKLANRRGWIMTVCGTLQTIAAPQQFVCCWPNSGHRYDDLYALSVQKRRIKWTEDFSFPLPPQLLLRLLCRQSPKKVEQNRYRNTLPR